MMMNKLVVPKERVESRIYLLRGQKVMLDKDLAELYGVKPIRLREQIKRNKKRFPIDFSFQLTEKEVDFLVSQNAIPSRKYLGGHLPYAFTEHGALMLSAILNSERAIEVGIFVVRAFVRMREMLSTHKKLLEKIDVLEKKYDQQFRVVFDAIKALINNPPKKTGKIGFLKE